MTWLDRMGRGLELSLVPLVLLLLIAPTLIIELWTDKTFVVSQGTFILTAAWGLIMLGAVARALQGHPVLMTGASRTSRWLMLFGGWVVLTSALAYQPSNAWFSAVATLTYLLLAQTVLGWLEGGTGRGRWLLAGLGAVVGIQTLVSGLQFIKFPFRPLADAVPVFTASDGTVLPGGSWLHDLLLSLANIGEQSAIVGTLGNYNYLAEFLVLALPVLAGAVLAWRSPLLRWMALATLGTSFLVLISTGGRGALLGLLVGGVVAAFLVFGRTWLDPRRYWQNKQARLATVVAVVLLAGLVALGGSRIQGKMSAVLSGNESSISSRLVNWQVAVSMVAERPVFGAGLGGYKLLNVERLAARYPEGLPPAAASSRFHHVHNEPLQAAVELGLPGLLILLGALWAWVREVRHNEALARPVRFGLLWGVGALLVAGAFGFPFHIPLTALALTLLLPLGVSSRTASPASSLAPAYRPVYALAALLVLGAAATLLFQKQIWPHYMAHRYAQVGQQLVAQKAKSPAVSVVLGLADRHLSFKGEVMVPEMKQLLESGQHEAALEVYERNQGLGAGMDALYWKGRALEKLGRREEAMAAFERVVNYYPENEPHHIMARRMLKRLGSQASS